MLLPAPSASADKTTKGKTADPQSGKSSRGSHEYASAAACKRLWALSHGLGLRAADDRPWRGKGTLFHTMLAYHYAEQLGVEARPDWFKMTTREEAVERDGVGLTPDTRRQIEAAFRAYLLKYSSDPFRPLAVEREFACRISDIAPPSLLDDPLLALHGGELITCRTDLIAEVNGELFAVDHKTTSTSTRTDGRLPAWNDTGEYRLNLQVLVNLHVVRRTYPTLKGFDVNRAKITPPFDFDRNIVRVPILAYAETALSLLDAADQQARALQRIEAGLPVPPNYSACFGRYGACDMADICAADSEAARGEMIQLLLK